MSRHGLGERSIPNPKMGNGRQCRVSYTNSASLPARSTCNFARTSLVSSVPGYHWTMTSQSAPGYKRPRQVVTVCVHERALRTAGQTAALSVRATFGHQGAREDQG